jgi:transcriptional regulator with XRE-family HTH domain
MPTTDDALYARIIEALINARTTAGLNRSQLAELVGVPVLVIADYESGAHRLDPSEFIALCRAIGVDPYALMQEAENVDGGPMNGTQPES